MSDSEFIGSKELRQLAGVSDKHLRNCIYRGDVPEPMTIVGRKVWPRADAPAIVAGMLAVFGKRGRGLRERNDPRDQVGFIGEVARDQ